MTAKPTDEALRDGIQGTLGPVFFSDLRAHLARDAVFLVDARLSIVDCGVAVARNDVAAVRAWLDASALRRPTADELAAWAAEPERRWLAVVVQPYVLLQDLAPPA